MSLESSGNDSIDALGDELGRRIDSQTRQIAIELRQQTEILGEKLDMIANAVIAGVLIIIGSLIVLTPIVYEKLEVFVR